MPIKTVSTQQSKQVLDATHFLQVFTGPVLIFDIEGEVNSTTGTAYYIQLLSTGAPSSGVTIPLYSRLAVLASAPTGNNGFSFVYRPIGLDTSKLASPPGGTAATDGTNTLPVYVAISSTDNVYTAIAASTQVSVDFEDTYLELANQTITGDTSTGVDSLTVYSDPNAAKRLVQFQVTNLNGTDTYLMLFGYSNPATGALPLEQWKVVNGTTLTQRFGMGFPIQQQDSNYALHTGCYLFGSSTTQTLTATSATSWYMKAWNV